MTDAPPPSIAPRPSGGRNGRRTVSSRVVPVAAAPDDVRVPEAIIAPVVTGPEAEPTVAPADDRPVAPVVRAPMVPDPVVPAPVVPDPVVPDPVVAAPVVPVPVVAAPVVPAPVATQTWAAEPVAAQTWAAEPVAAQTWAAEPWATAPAIDEPGHDGRTSALAEADVDDDDAPTPLAAAVEKTTSWLRKAGTVTTSKVSSAYASISRPAPEEVTMTSTNAAPSPLGAVDTDASWPVDGTSRPIVAGPRLAAPQVGGSSRRVRLVVARVDPWSVMKLSFLLSFALGIIGVVGTAVVWFTLDGLHVFAKLNDLVSTVAGTDSSGQVLSYFSFGKVVAGSMLVGVVDVFLLTAVATIAAFLYNIVAALVGGLHVTMTDD